MGSIISIQNLFIGIGLLLAIKIIFDNKKKAEILENKLKEQEKRELQNNNERSIKDEDEKKGEVDVIRNTFLAEKPQRLTRVLIIGDARIGKSTLIEHLLDMEVGTISKESADSVTLDCQPYLKRNYHLIDTAGFNDGSKGLVSAGTAISKLINFLRKNQEGFNSIVLLSEPNASSSFESNCELIKKLARNKIPVYLVINKADILHDIKNWKTNEVPKFQRYFNFNKIFLFCLFNKKFQRLTTEEKFSIRRDIEDFRNQLISDAFHDREVLYTNFMDFQNLALSLFEVIRSLIRKEDATKAKQQLYEAFDVCKSFLFEAAEKLAQKLIERLLK